MEIMAQTIFNAKQEEIKQIALVADEEYDLCALKVPAFLKSQFPEEGQKHEFPEFYGIPKIHKNPAGEILQ
ncbi:hypothetical protein DICSQDRAFT_175321 [Dichomitus squalens LYAD-421 SS1]|uniref:Uncharacterized protein n=1 Tax=Dichomitus squalens (strain LYAD-421) TaxID=732165 RepID=R7SJR3_DICSQ|nr:uncharacterized protein DICSQDRAFT_175321 [Dichomitus squalens LYAD-421 SS1]EJF55970.1 hypothetical protein DICSQDRAFT_175321 [Dichomitus squalens LYAD-421 SS1]